MAVMAATAENRNYTSIVNRGASTKLCFYWEHVIGSGDLNKLYLSDFGWYHNTSSSTVNIPNAFTIVKCHIDNGVIAVPVLYSGARSKTVNPGDDDSRSDAILPSAFGLEKFTKGQVYRTKIEIDLPAINNSIPFSERYTAHRAGQQAIDFDPAATTIVNGVDVVGPFTTTGVAPTPRSQGYCPIVLGEYINESQVKVFYVEGDSIVQNVGDTSSPTPVGNGWFQRAIYGDGSNIYASVNYAKSGAFSTTFNGSTNDRHAKGCRFANIAILETATNDFGITGTLLTFATMQQRQTDKIAKAKSYGIKKIISTLLLPRTTSTSGNWLNDADQAVTGAGWDSGGNVQQYNQWQLSNISVDYIIRFDSSRSAGNQFFWDANGTNKYKTTDGTHPSTLMHELMGADARAVFDSVILPIVLPGQVSSTNFNLGLYLGI